VTEQVFDRLRASIFLASSRLWKCNSHTNVISSAICRASQADDNSILARGCGLAASMFSMTIQ
jgi:hypothetical protein